MKNHKLFLLLLTFFYLNIQPTFSQKYDNTWLMGYYYSSFTNVTGLDFYFGNPVSVALRLHLILFQLEAHACQMQMAICFFILMGVK
ncbi:MAG: hypothetical protein IPK08_10265 [Bacteroidetes bacterium]|nr:hypothetical protein [Bacteroidota bacterium]